MNSSCLPTSSRLEDCHLPVPPPSFSLYSYPIVEEALKLRTMGRQNLSETDLGIQVVKPYERGMTDLLKTSTGSIEESPLVVVQCLCRASILLRQTPIRRDREGHGVSCRYL